MWCSAGACVARTGQSVAGTLSTGSTDGGSIYGICPKGMLLTVACTNFITGCDVVLSRHKENCSGCSLIQHTNNVACDIFCRRA